MIRAGRAERVQTLADLAAAIGVSEKTVRNTRPYTAEGFPAPVSSPDAQKLLWDSEQTAAHLAGQPVPALPVDESDEDLLDRHEAAAECGVGVTTWNTYKRDPAVADHLRMVGGVEHWPRQAVRSFRDSRPGRGSAHAGGRPQGSGDLVPRDQILDRVTELLDQDPAVTATTVMDELGIAMTTATAHLATLRGRHITDLLEAHPDLTSLQAAEHLGYPKITHRRALAAADIEQRVRAARPYVQSVIDALAAAGYAEPAQADVTLRDSGALAAAARLLEGAPAPALVWDERFGWRTTPNRRHPMGKDSATRPEGTGIRYLGRTERPAAATVVAALRA
ncbi:DUF6292 family protein [Streptomyces sp. NPDC017964]|uniref:DUF6292 family protein n=1 Tax=Streptomyces sp. NPDC017964 TaxID=3365022 RepID=UPI0037B0A196